MDTGRDWLGPGGWTTGKAPSSQLSVPLEVAVGWLTGPTSQGLGLTQPLSSPVSHLSSQAGRLSSGWCKSGNPQQYSVHVPTGMSCDVPPAWPLVQLSSGELEAHRKELGHLVSL